MSPARIAFRARAAGALLIALAAGGAPAEEDPYASVRAEFRAAYDAAATAGAAASDSDALRAYPLYPYLERVRIAAELRASDERAARADALAREFLERHAGEPVSADLRDVWLRSLARRKAWTSFLANFRPSSDPALRCEHFNARIATGATADLAEDIVAAWLTPRQLPQECIEPFDWLRARGALGAGLVEQRVRAMLENGEAAFARVVARELPTERAAPLLLWARLLEQPQATLDSVLAARAELEPAALLAGWTKLARNDPAAALERYPQMRRARGLDDAHESKVALALALGLAWDRRPEAAQLFDDVARTDLDDYALEWRARAALWAGDWRAAGEAIGALSEERRATPRWLYWAARVAEQRGDRATATLLYEAALPFDNYYAAISAARLGRQAAPHPEPLPIDHERLSALAASDGLVRARELLLAGLSVSAANEWAAVHTSSAADDRKQLVHLAASWGWHDVSVATATRENVFFDYAVLYPRPYADEVLVAAEHASIAVPLLYGVIRQESLFRADAISSSGAMGLAQVTPATARVVARAAREPVPNAADMLEPRANVRLGASYLRMLMDRYGGQLPIALAAYNAGPNAAERWLPETPLDADIWIENIPYNETRDYVQRVLWHSVVFGWLQTGAPQDTASWTARIARPTAALAADE